MITEYNHIIQEKYKLLIIRKIRSWNQEDAIRMMKETIYQKIATQNYFYLDTICPLLLEFIWMSAQKDIQNELDEEEYDWAHILLKRHRYRTAELERIHFEDLYFTRVCYSVKLMN